VVIVNRYRFAKGFGRVALVAGTAVILTACQEGAPLFKTTPKSETVPAAAKKFIEKDVEAPEVFQKTAKALWDGRPSLGGVWVAHPANKKPERVIIRNKANGKFVIGALFNREASLPGPAFQLSSDAASAIGATAGTTLEISVTAMRIQKTAVADPKAPKPAPSEDIASSTLKALDETKAPAAKTKKAVTKPVKKAAKTAVAPNPTVTPPAAPANAVYAQLGLFSVEANANATLAKLKAKGLAGKIVKSSAKGKTFFRVLAGPVSSTAEKAKLLTSVKSMGFADAYFVKG
jgi:cell division septation protein DedD